MDVRKKLVEMSEQLRYCADVSDCANCKRWDKVCENKCVDNLLLMAADLIDEVTNGVTVQEWISVKDRLPDEMKDEYVLVVCDYHGKIEVETRKMWNIDSVVTHWQPMPQPPKGE